MPVWNVTVQHHRNFARLIMRSGATVCCRRWVSHATACLALISVLGCGDAAPTRLKVYPVEGSITFKGKPLADALVVLHPKDKADTKITAARGKTDQNGKFLVTTYDTNDGAAAGEYAVTVQKYQTVDKGGGPEPGPNILPPKLSLPTSTDVFVQIAEGSNTLKPVEVGR